MATTNAPAPNIHDITFDQDIPAATQGKMVGIHVGVEGHVEVQLIGESGATVRHFAPGFYPYLPKRFNASGTDATLQNADNLFCLIR